MSQQAAASEDPEPAGGEGRPGEEEEKRKKEEEEKEANKVVENGGLPGPTVVVQSRTIRSPSDAFLQLQIGKKERGARLFSPEFYDKKTKVLG